MGNLAYRLAAMGDIMLDRAVGRHFLDRPRDFGMEDVASILAAYDVVFANLENPVGVTGTPHRIQHPNVTFRCHPRSLEVLGNLHVTAVSLANNHLLDYGPAALAETLEHLDARGIKHAGAGRNYEEANRPALFEANGRKIAMLAYVFLYSASTERATRARAGVSDHRIRSIVPRIRELSGLGYDVLVSAHWGREYAFYPLPYQMAQARKMIDAGAAIVIGHGPHYPQGIESYRDRAIVYSLGNFVFDEPHRYANRSFIFGGEITADSVRDWHIHPVRLRNHVPTLAYGKEKEQIEKLIAKLSRLYPARDRKFWQHQNSLYFRDLLYRVSRMKSFKFMFLPPLSFYGGVGIANYARKVMPWLKPLVR